MTKKKKLRSKMKFGVGNCLSLMRVKLNVVIPWGGFVLRDNQFSGEIPHGINDFGRSLMCLIWVIIDFVGNIPSELGTLPRLNFLDLYGEIPMDLQNLMLFWV
jgi:hypothetical protein